MKYLVASVSFLCFMIAMLPIVFAAADLYAIVLGFIPPSPMRWASINPFLLMLGLFFHIYGWLCAASGVLE